MPEPRRRGACAKQRDGPQRIYLYKRYERFWHWSQAALVISMLATGFEVHGSYHLLGFERAVQLHTLAAWTLMLLWVFTAFWQFTTGEWRQYTPTLANIVAVARFYAWGIFRGEPHPYRKTVQKKHNPLQRLTYLALLTLVLPAIWITGLVYLFRAYWPSLGLESLLRLDWVAWAHTAAAFMMLVFVIVHVYLTTTGHTPLAHIKSMITGWEELHEPQADMDEELAAPPQH
ncbi:MAG TPA: cytochrome b/b6 domain-containing protein [Ottowia sp.]|uniref:cytochrome b/b6 domain-containing protein n=1 Tax=Ottowia sp. TaxID=1898956 RepID=UPI002BED8759|nr:cytochrome b/b6 domain-containing protein [Ottowia sp.]HMN21407.1 cytochrome b/b6 domain-containing protein [Ottowia sp.]